jgi:osmoprotectant transport system substrate-binding protein
MHPTPRILRLLAALAALALLLTACNGGGDGADTDTDTGEDGAAADAGGGGTLTIGSANFDEAELVASMYALVLEDAGYDVNREFLFGNRETYYAALEGGDLDLVPEYVGSLVTFLTAGEEEASSDPDETVRQAQDLVADDGLELLEPSDAQNANGFVVTSETADEYGLSSLSDLEGVSSELVLGGPPECPERPLCLQGLTEVYGVEFADFQPLDAGGPQTVGALSDGVIDVGLLFTTDESIRINDWVLLEDDQGLQPAENVTPVIRSEVLDDTIRERLNAVSAELTTDELTELNRRVRFEGEDPEDVAQSWLEEKGLL